MADDGEKKEDEPGACTKFCFAVLDFLAMIFRCVVAVCSAVKRCCQREGLLFLFKFIIICSGSSSCEFDVYCHCTYWFKIKSKSSIFDDC